MDISPRPPVCPYESAIGRQAEVFEQPAPPVGMPNPDELRLYMLDWYQKAGFRGCLFNKVAARDARRGEFAWPTPVEYEAIDAIIAGSTGGRVLANFESLIGDGQAEGLVSYMFPGVDNPQALGDLLKFLAASNPDRFRILEVVNREFVEEFDEEFVGIQFRIKVGETDDGQEAMAYPMIYNPWPFTTFARRFDIPKITFNRFNSKQNPETADTYIGVDDIDLTQQLTPANFARMLERSVAVNRQAHSSDGTTEGFAYSRKLFRAHNALVLPASAWDN